MRIERTHRVAIALTAMLAGCVTPVERATPPAVPLTAAALESARTLSGSRDGQWPQGRWWEAFGDAQLDSLVEEALAGHPSLRVARARLAQAQALVDAAVSNATLGTTGSLDLTRQRYSVSGTVPPPVAGTTRTNIRVALDLGYEIDFAGRNDAAIAAARAAEASLAADVYAARLALSSTVARTYFQLQRLFALNAIALRELAQYERRVELTRQRVAAGLETEAVLSRVQAVPPELRADIAQMQAAVAIARHQLAALAGKGPDRGLTIAPAQSNAAAVPLPENLPLDLIGRRPDLAAARWRAESAARDIEVARARFLPNVNLLAFVGIAALGIDRLFEGGSGIAGAGPAIRLPLFAAGGLQASLRGREADYDLAVERYNELVLDAVREVADQAQALRSLDVERNERRQALAALERAYRLALERNQAGIASTLEVLEAEAGLFPLQRSDADLRVRGLQAEVGLFRALGGGYEDGRTRTD